MGVTRSCDPGNGAVDLDVSAGQVLEYRIPAADPNVQYVLAESGGGTVFDRASHPPPCVVRWPGAGTPPGPGDEVRHTLSMQFFGDEELTYRVERLAADGSVLEVVKECSFRNAEDADEFFEPLRVFIS